VAVAKRPDETVVAWGYDIIAMGGRHLDKAMLDAISATQPIVVWDASEHFAYANSAALRKYKVTRDDTRLDGVIAGPDGDPNGQFLGVSAVQLILKGPLAEVLEPDIALKNMRFLADLGRKNGITTTSDLAFGSINPDLEQSLLERFFNDGQNPMRCVVVSDA